MDRFQVARSMSASSAKGFRAALHGHAGVVHQNIDLPPLCLRPVEQFS